MNAKIEDLQHRVRFLELLCEEFRLKAKRMALQAGHYERRCKLLARVHSSTPELRQEDVYQGQP